MALHLVKELDKQKNDDPIIGFKSMLMAEGKLDEARFAEMDREAKRLAAESVRFAEESPNPPMSDLYTDIYAADSRSHAAALHHSRVGETTHGEGA